MPPPRTSIDANTTAIFAGAIYADALPGQRRSDSVKLHRVARQLTTRKPQVQSMFEGTPPKVRPNWFGLSGASLEMS
jgi:hypothetical protein